MTNRENAARAATRGNLFFFACVMLALLAGAFAATAENKTMLILGLSFAGVFLVLGGVLVYIHSRIVGKYMALAKEEEAALAARAAEEERKNIETFSEDGLPGAFCYEIRGYSPAQLRLILDEQRGEYTEEEYAFIEKVLSEKA
ncbi:MAG: hypothetical protein E7609_04295 [Ruminococcaceae bacterium]|nr:hypothetical protein [Oscillospiraceae bacterium]